MRLEVLTFYRQFALFQQKLYAQIPGHRNSQPAARAFGQLRSELNFDALLPHFPVLLSLAENAGPSRVVEAARRLSAKKPTKWLTRLTDFWLFGGRTNHSGREGVAGDAREALTQFLLQAGPGSAITGGYIERKSRAIGHDRIEAPSLL